MFFLGFTVHTVHFIFFINNFIVIQGGHTVKGEQWSVHLMAIRQPPLTVRALKHDQSSGEAYVTTLTLQKAFEACQANKSAWLQHREELTQAQQAYREQLAGSGDSGRSLQTLREIIDVKK